jgi:hypothetical protein
MRQETYSADKKVSFSEFLSAAVFKSFTIEVVSGNVSTWNWLLNSSYIDSRL